MPSPIGPKAAALLALVMLLAAATDRLDQPPPSATARAPEKIYAATCGYCHGANVGPLIRGRALPAESVRMIVRHGQNGMPAFRPTEISNGELDALAAWLQASKADPKEKGE